MKTLFEDDLVEAVLTLCARGRRPGVPPLQIARYQAGRERCYICPDPDERQEAFARLNLDWFREWNLAGQLTAAAGRFPRLANGLTTLAFRKARMPADEGAELYANNQAQRQGVLALRPDRFANPPALDRMLHHELAHLADMVDPDFDYSPLPAGASAAAARERLLRERYRLLWNISVDGRLTQRQLATIADGSRRRAEFDRAFNFLTEARRTELFDPLWSGRLARHAELLALALDPRDLQDAPVPLPGAPCPLCGFTAFTWIEVNGLRPHARSRLSVEFPDRPEPPSICERCAEIYESIAGLTDPPTVCL